MADYFERVGTPLGLTDEEADGAPEQFEKVADLLGLDAEILAALVERAGASSNSEQAADALQNE